MSETEKITALNQWVTEVAAALDVEAETLSACVPTLLDLVRRVAHGPSRPGGPVTAFALGLLLGRQAAELSGETAAAFVAELATRLDEPLARYATSSAAEPRTNHGLAKAHLSAPVADGLVNLGCASETSS